MCDLVEVRLVITCANYGGKEKCVCHTEYLTVDYTSEIAVINVTEAIIP